MAGSMSVDDIIIAIKELDEEQRDSLILQLVQIDELMEELEDYIDLIRSRSEPRQPFDDFLAEMRAEGRDV